MYHEKYFCNSFMREAIFRPSYLLHKSGILNQNDHLPAWRNFWKNFRGVCMYNRIHMIYEILAKNFIHVPFSASERWLIISYIVHMIKTVPKTFLYLDICLNPVNKSTVKLKLMLKPKVKKKHFRIMIYKGCYVKKYLGFFYFNFYIN